ncbi:putative Ring finger protein [Quillaja saponaria]|uniref:RING-type E3 ubiquitin transferase n=1 Tax=Quillaja saponaria TaxID=32244 RepID=A0AAD7L4H1_QUISA|nr:putative Ring finger protein [Quillaja saponaria]
MDDDPNNHKASKFEKDLGLCVVCLNQIYNRENSRFLPVCLHSFHGDCIDAWLKNHATCPLCRNDANYHNDDEQDKFPHLLISMYENVCDVLRIHRTFP